MCSIKTGTLFESARNESGTVDGPARRSLGLHSRSRGGCAAEKHAVAPGRPRQRPASLGEKSAAAQTSRARRNASGPLGSGAPSGALELAAKAARRSGADPSAQLVSVVRCGSYMTARSGKTARRCWSTCATSGMHFFRDVPPRLNLELCHETETRCKTLRMSCCHTLPHGPPESEMRAFKYALRNSRRRLPSAQRTCWWRLTSQGSVTACTPPWMRRDWCAATETFSKSRRSQDICVVRFTVCGGHGLEEHAMLTLFLEMKSTVSSSSEQPHEGTFESPSSSSLPNSLVERCENPVGVLTHRARTRAPCPAGPRACSRAGSSAARRSTCPRETRPETNTQARHF